ncbi:hypothetical protein CH373_11075 [Leptospira perolatii]|uniref:Uncharacterized protein n=1 Tax=Leptospira perolatii TaxID=2023191 RepID=A0A2M9ZM19_9LEPT|nr:hypothetical protein [Leptospira perolatii]PJZ69751.1 hypothetical protein CH360_09160 [Leptospira perolatii]PJZ73034.1 hypothetical protein CH373_11075 [Leptospira perolatii]
MNQPTPCGENCGIQRTSPFSREVKSYSKSAWFLILFGISSKPTEVRFQCTKCGKFYDRLSPEELANYA